MWLIYLLGIPAALAGGFLVVARMLGARHPPEHSFARTVALPAPPEEVWKVITDYAGQTAWQPWLRSVERVADRDGAEAWRVQQKAGPPMVLVTRESLPPSRLVREIVDEKKVFSGTWTWELAAEGEGTRLTLTENGRIENPIFRFMLHAFGPSKYVDNYLRALGTRLGAEDVLAGS
jgi:uncharacterized protein YndB with AHSA1/START domain